jgi:Ca2+-dependent lipid-binding protein
VCSAPSKHFLKTEKLAISSKYIMSQIEIYLSAKNLPNKDSFSKSDPFAVLLTKKTPADQFKEFDRSEVVKDNLSPEFSKRFLLDYVFEVEQICKVMIFDCDDVKSGDLSKHDFLGFVEFTLAELVTTPGQVLHKNLLDKNGKLIRKNCVITVKGEESSSSKDIIKLSLRAEKLDKKDLFGKSDPL